MQNFSRNIIIFFTLVPTLFLFKTFFPEVVTDLSHAIAKKVVAINPDNSSFEATVLFVLLVGLLLSIFVLARDSIGVVNRTVHWIFLNAKVRKFQAKYQESLKLAKQSIAVAAE